MFQEWLGIGRLTADPELQYTPNGTPVAKFTLAIDRPKNKDGEKQTDFIDIIAWRDQAENCAKYLSKGSPAAVVGRLQIRSYEDSQGIRRKAAEIVANRVIFLPDPRKNGSKKIEDPPFPPDEEPPVKDDFPGEENFGNDEIKFDEDEVPF